MPKNGKIPPQTKPAVRLLEVTMETVGRPDQQLVLCSRCLAKRRKKAPPLNTSARMYGAKGRFLGWGRHSHPIWYSRGVEVRTDEKVQCMDCGFTYRGTNRKSTPSWMY